MRKATQPHSPCGRFYAPQHDEVNYSTALKKTQHIFTSGNTFLPLQPWKPTVKMLVKFSVLPYFSTFCKLLPAMWNLLHNIWYTRLPLHNLCSWRCGAACKIRSCTNSRSIQIREPKLPVARRKIAGILCVFQDFSTQPAAILAAKLGAEVIGTASKRPGLLTKWKPGLFNFRVRRLKAPRHP